MTKTSWSIFWHILATLMLLYGIFNTFLLNVKATTSIHEIYVAVMMCKYLLFAIFFEVIAVQCKRD